MICDVYTPKPTFFLYLVFVAEGLERHAIEVSEDIQACELDVAAQAQTKQGSG